MAKPFFIVVPAPWLRTDQNQKQLQRGRIPLGFSSPFDRRCELFLKARKRDGALESDQEDPFIDTHDEKAYLHSKMLKAQVDDVVAADESDCLVLYFEGTNELARCISQWWDQSAIAEITSRAGPQVAALYDLPPRESTTIDGESVVTVFRAFAEERDSDLFAVQARRFLDGPHILERLLDHLMQLRAIEAPNFITVAKGLSDELRSLLDDENSPVRIQNVTHSHVDLWASVQGSPVAFIDGGVARFDGFPGIEQFALRVGTYRVTPGDADPKTREVWSMCPVSRNLDTWA